MNDCYRLDVYVPETHVESLKEALFHAGAGRIGNYECCCWQTEGTGQFRPIAGAHPFLGRQDETETVSEWKLELLVCASDLRAVLAALKAAHPYETPAFQFWPVGTAFPDDD